MKTLNLIAMAGLSFGMAMAAMGAPDGEKADLTPKFKAGETFTFKHHVVRSETMSVIIGNMQMRGAEKPAESKGDAPKAEPGKGDAPGAAAPKAEPAKAEPSKAEPVKAEPGKEGAKDGDKSAMRQTWKVDQTSVYQLRVVSASEAGASLELELKSVDASGDLPLGKTTWNSEDKAEGLDQKNPILKAYKPIVGAILKITLDANGNVSDVKGDPRVNLDFAGTLAPMVQVMVGPDMVRAKWGPALWIKDGREPAKVGQTWKNTESVYNRAMNGKFVCDSTNVLKSVNGDLAIVEITGEFRLVAADAGKPVQGTLTEQMFKGNAVWDTKVGVVKTYSTTERTHLDMSANGIPVTRNLDATTTITRE